MRKSFSERLYWFSTTKIHFEFSNFPIFVDSFQNLSDSRKRDNDMGLISVKTASLGECAIYYSNVEWTLARVTFSSKFITLKISKFAWE